MTPSLLIFQTIGYSFALWLGFYLIARDLTSIRLRLTGLGLVAYALALGTDLLTVYAPTPNITQILVRLQGLLLFLPALLWVGTLAYLLPLDLPARPRLIRGWTYGLLPGVVLFYLIIIWTDLGPHFSTSGFPIVTPIYLLFAIAILFPLLGTFLLLGYELRAAKRKKILGVLLTATLFLGLGAGLLLFPVFKWLPRTWLVLAIEGDLLLLGFAIVALDALDEGEALLPDFLLAFDLSFFSVLLFAGPAMAIIIFSSGVTFTMLLLLLATIVAAIARQTFSNQFDTLIDRLALVAFPKLQQARAELRTTTRILPRVNSALDPTALDETEFTRLTRRALSHFGDFSRLATNPLTRLPVVETSLNKRGLAGDTLERAAELKIVLTKSIERLKPRDKGDFGTSDEWRYYNALYFPYVVGLKPYSRRAEHNGLDPVARQALEWFRTAVPERTLYNWQNVAARLVAQDLRER